MKKLLVVLFALLLTASMSACNDGGKKSEKNDTIKIKTIGDAFRFASENEEGVAWEYDQDEVVVAYYDEDTILRYSGHFSEAIYNKLEEINFFDEERNEKYAEILDAVLVEKTEDLSDKIPTQKKCDSFIGKTGQDLLDIGAFLGGYDLNDEDNPKFFINIGLFQYEMTFNGHIEYEEDLDEVETIKTLTVKEVTYRQIGDITNLDYTE